MSLFTRKVPVKKENTAHNDPLFWRFWKEVGEPLQHQSSRLQATAEQESNAKLLLQETLRRCKRLMPKTRRYLANDFTYDVGYFGTLLQLRQLLEKERWCSACAQLCKMIRYYCANDIRTMYTIIGILEEFI